MQNFSSEELNVLKNGDEKFKPFIDISSLEFYSSNVEDKKFMKLAFQEFERIYSNWRFFLFESKLNRFSCKSPANKGHINKIITFCHQHKINFIDMLMKLNEFSLQGKVNKEAFYQLHYISSDNMLTSFLEKKLLQKKTKIENTFANVANNQTITSLCKSYLGDNGFVFSEEYTDRYFQTVLAVLKDMSKGKRINCSQNIKDMCNCLMKSQTIMNMLK
jgi:hypothetical protein